MYIYKRLEAETANDKSSVTSREREIETDRERVSEAEVIETLLPPCCSHFRCMTSFQLVHKDSHNTSPHQCARQSTSEGGDNN